MRRLRKALLVACVVASTLGAARCVVHTWVYVRIHAIEVADPSAGRRTRFVEVSRNIRVFIEQLDDPNLVWPILPLARAVGLIEPSTIVASGLILAAISLRPISPRRRTAMSRSRRESIAFHQLLERINHPCPSSASRPRSAPMPKGSTAWTPPASPSAKSSARCSSSTPP